MKKANSKTGKYVFLGLLLTGAGLLIYKTTAVKRLRTQVFSGQDLIPYDSKYWDTHFYYSLSDLEKMDQNQLNTIKTDQQRFGVGHSN